MGSTKRRRKDKTNNVHLRVTNDEKAGIEAAAERDKRSVSSWLLVTAMNAIADDNSIHLRVSEEEKAAIEAAATRDKRTVEAWLVVTAMSAIAKQK